EGRRDGGVLVDRVARQGHPRRGHEEDDGRRSGSTRGSGEEPDAVRRRAPGLRRLHAGGRTGGLTRPGQATKDVGAAFTRRAAFRLAGPMARDTAQNAVSIDDGRESGWAASDVPTCETAKRSAIGATMNVARHRTWKLMFFMTGTRMVCGMSGPKWLPSMARILRAAPHRLPDMDQARATCPAHGHPAARGRA